MSNPVSALNHPHSRYTFDPLASSINEDRTPLEQNRLPLLDPHAVSIPRVEDFVDASEAARFLKYHPKTVLRMAREGALPAHPLTGQRRRQWCFLVSELDEWARGKVNSACGPCQNFRRM